MSGRAIHSLTAVAVIAAGMAGLYLQIEYSGWVLLVGLFTIPH